MKYLIILLCFSFVACQSQIDVNSNDNRTELIQEVVEDLKGPKCPKNHTDSLVPIVYGYPSEDLFAMADSGLVILGGCELGEDNYFCKIHRISF